MQSINLELYYHLLKMNNKEAQKKVNENSVGKIEMANFEKQSTKVKEKAKLN